MAKQCSKDWLDHIADEIRKQKKNDRKIKGAEAYLKDSSTTEAEREAAIAALKRLRKGT